jgi:hypothetical protein
MKFIKTNSGKVVNQKYIEKEIDSIVGWVKNENGDCIITFDDGDWMVVGEEGYNLFLFTIENLYNLKETNHIIDKLAERILKKYQVDA